MFDLFDHDKKTTLENRSKLMSNKNLLLWYKELYRHQFQEIRDIEKLKILEIGSGTSPIKLFHHTIMTSDLLDMDHVDHHFDCHEIHNYEMIADKSLDIITMTNVLHHLAEPLKFLTNAASKLRQGGQIIMTEPYYSTLSKLIFTRLHHEPSDFSIDKPHLQQVRGPLSSANMAVPYMMFIMREDWRSALYDYYDFSERSISFFSSLSYMATGGISRKLPIPNLLYKRFLSIDLYLARKFPGLLCSFFTIKLRKK